MVKVLAYPRGENPYQSLLYNSLNPSLIKVTYFEPTKSRSVNLGLLYFILPFYRLRGYTVFHLHWIEFCFPFYSLPFLAVSLLNTIFTLIWIRVLGFNLIWTVHNITPHSKKTLNDLLVAKLTISLSNSIIIHSPQTLHDFHQLGLNVKNYSIVPIGIYSHYSNSSTKRNLRQELGISPDKKVLLFFGFIRKYKGIKMLLESFDILLDKYPDIVLLIAGQSSDAELANEILHYKRKLNDKLFFFDQFISDNEIQYFFNAADISIFPFESNTTSSSVVLSLSFRKPVIAPLIGNIVDLPDSLGYFYWPSSVGELKKTIEFFLDNGTPKKFEVEVDKLLKKMSWKSIGEKTEKIILGLSK